MFKTPSKKSLHNSQFFKKKNDETSKSNISNIWREKRGNMLDIMIQKILFLKFNMMIKIVVNSFEIKVYYSINLIYIL